MNIRQARRVVRSRAAVFCREQADRQGDTVPPGDRNRIVTAWHDLATYLDPGELDADELPTNLQPLVRPDGSTFAEWHRTDLTTEGTDGAAAPAQ